VVSFDQENINRSNAQLLMTLCLIRDNVTHALLFAGVVMNPVLQ